MTDKPAPGANFLRSALTVAILSGCCAAAAFALRVEQLTIIPQIDVQWIELPATVCAFAAVAAWLVFLVWDSK